MKLTKVINVPIYNCKVRVIFTDDSATEVRKVLKKCEIKDDDQEDCYGVAVKGVDVHSYYLVYDTKGLTSNTISHEISHLVGFILEDREIDDTPSSENVAYLNGYFNQTIRDFAIKKAIKVS